jgi:outer membrane biosynthesis protein TonB
MTAERLEGVAQVAIMLIIGATAGAASFTHVHDVTVAHGQPHWIGWANACVVELMSIALGLELRRRARTHRPTAFVATALVFFILVSLAAQVVEAEPSVVGWLAAALPAIGFLVLAKVVLSRTAATTSTVTTPAPAPEPAVQPVDEHQAVTAPVVVDPVDEHPRPATNEPAEQPAPAVTEVPSRPEVPAHLLPTARFAVVNHEQATGRTITADELAARLSIAPTMAGQLLGALTEPPSRVNGAAVRGAV